MPSLASTATAALPATLPTGRRAAWSVAAGLAVVVVLLWVWWPAGVVLGLAFSAGTLIEIGRRVKATADADFVDQDLVVHLDAAREAEAAHPPQAAPAPVDPELAAAARLVVTAQYASAARLQRELHVPYARARRILGELEREHVVGPPTGTLPRRVLVPADRLSDALSRIGASAR